MGFLSLVRGPQVKRVLSSVGKIAISALIVAVLLQRASRDGAFAELIGRTKDWSHIGLAAAICLLTVGLLNVRWWLLVRAAGLPFTLKAAFRIGFVGYLFNLAPMGVVGGDLIRSVMLIRQVDGHRARAVASVIVDRVIGLYLLFVVAAAAAFTTGFWRHDRRIALVSLAALAVTLAGAAALLFVMLLPGWVSRRVLPILARLPRVGSHVLHLVDAIRMYRHQRLLLSVTTVLSLVIHVLTVYCTHLLACGLFTDAPAFADQLVVVPLSITTSVIPLPMGPYEAGLEFLYLCMGMPAHEGLIVALAYRFLIILVAVIGMAYYFASKGEVQEALKAAGEGESLDSLADEQP